MIVGAIYVAAQSTTNNEAVTLNSSTRMACRFRPAWL
jgi:hypothetical protein